MSEKHANAKRVSVTSGSPRNHGGAGPFDVLVVEDNPVNQKLVVALLTKWGHRAVVAGDGTQCLEALASQRFDLVLMDVQMPGMDGIEATRSIRARELELGGHIRIIAITAHAATQDQVRCLEAGMDRYLTKPLDSRLLRDAIEDLLPAAVPEMKSPSVKAIGGPVDFEQLKEFVGEDPELLAEVIQIFLDDAPVTLENAASGISNADAHAVEVSAHRLKGSLSTMGAAAAAETANLLESLGREGVLDGASELHARLSREVEATREVLRIWKGQLAA